MPLVRIATPDNLNRWDKEPLEPEKILKDWFGPFREDNPPSVYEANTELDEVEVSGAVSLTNLGKGLTVYHILRIDWGDLEALGASARASNDVLGNTGVVAVDFRHWELPNDQAFLTRLVERIFRRSLQGEDRFRWVGKLTHREQLQQFLGCPDNQVIQEAKRCCSLKLQGITNRHRPLGEEIQQELEAAPPAIPPHRIAPLARQKYQERGGRFGTPLNDWLTAERELRSRYLAGLVE